MTNQPDEKSKRPIENQGTAAWSNIEKQKKISKESIPSLYQTENAKEYVDKNEK